MSMEDWDFGYYGKGLDGYVHFRQGIKEIESHAPYSKCRHGRDDSLDDLDDLDEYDDPEDDLFYEPPQKTPVSSAAAICFAFISLHPYFRLSSASSSPDIIAGRLRRIFSSSQSHQLSRLSFSIVSSSKRLRIGFAGVPPTMV